MDFNTYKSIRAKFKQAAYYIIVGVVSFISMVFLPILNSDIDGGFNWPTDKMGWIIWSLQRGGIALVNICLFYCFMEQAKVNAKTDEKYLEACKIMSRLKLEKEVLPRSPKVWTAKQYGFKGTTLVIASVISSWALSNAILKFDLVTFLSSVFTILMGLIFGYLQMRKAEDYWTEEFWQYAKIKENEYKLSSQEQKCENEPILGQINEDRKEETN